MRMMFSWLFTSWRNMISRKVRCASVAFWKASKIFLSATVSRVFLSTAFHTIPYAWRREVARQPGARRRIGRRAEREGQPGCPRVARAERRGAGGSRSAFCPPATASQLAVLSLLAWQRRKESHRGSQVCSQRLAGAFGSSQGPRLAAGPRVPRARGTRAHTPPARRRGCAAARSVAGLRAACPSRSHAPACPCAMVCRSLTPIPSTACIPPHAARRARAPLHLHVWQTQPQARTAGAVRRLVGARAWPAAAPLGPRRCAPRPRRVPHVPPCPGAARSRTCAARACLSPRSWRARASQRSAARGRLAGGKKKKKKSIVKSPCRAAGLLDLAFTFGGPGPPTARGTPTHETPPRALLFLPTVQMRGPHPACFLVPARLRVVSLLPPGDDGVRSVCPL